MVCPCARVPYPLASHETKMEKIRISAWMTTARQRRKKKQSQWWRWRRHQHGTQIRGRSTFNIYFGSVGYKSLLKKKKCIKQTLFSPLLILDYCLMSMLKNKWKVMMMNNWFWFCFLLCVYVRVNILYFYFHLFAGDVSVMRMCVCVCVYIDECCILLLILLWIHHEYWVCLTKYGGGVCVCV